MQIIRFGVASGGHLGNQVADHIGGYRVPRDGLPATFRDASLAPPTEGIAASRVPTPTWPTGVFTLAVGADSLARRGQWTSWLDASRGAPVTVAA